MRRLMMLFGLGGGLIVLLPTVVSIFGLAACVAIVYRQGPTSGRFSDQPVAAYVSSPAERVEPAVLTVAYTGGAGGERVQAEAYEPAPASAPVFETYGTGALEIEESVPINMPNAARTNGHDGMPAIANDGGRTFLVLWQSNDTMDGTAGADTDILAVRSTNGGRTWSDNFLLNSDATSDSRGDINPAAAGALDGTWLAAWCGSSEGIQLARSSDSGEKWDMPVRIGGGSYPDIKTDGRGTWIVTWMNRTDGVLARRSTDNGVTWQPEVTIGRTSGMPPLVETDGHGNWVILWADSMMMVSHSADHGATWEAPVELGVVAEDRPDLGVDDSGVFIAATSAAVPWPDMSTFEQDAVGFRSTDGGKSWSAAIPLHGDALTDNGYDQRPRLAGGANGRWLALWYAQNRQTGEDNDIYFTTSEDHGLTWSDPLPFNSYAGAEPGSDAYGGVACDGDGNWIGVWNSNYTFDGKVIVPAGNVIAGRARWKQ